MINNWTLKNELLIIFHSVYNGKTSEAKPESICVCGGYDASNKPQTHLALFSLRTQEWSSFNSTNFSQRYFRFAGSSFVTVDLPDVDEENELSDTELENFTGRTSQWANVALPQAFNLTGAGDNR